MKKLFLLLLFIATLNANDKAHSFAPSEDCKQCHNSIYQEFSASMHTHSTPQKDRSTKIS